jgi:Protein of unknown function (DUF3617)
MKSIPIKTSLAFLLLSACTAAPSPDAALHRQSGSWTLVNYTMDFRGENLTGDMAEMLKAGRASVGKKDIGGPVCLTPALVAKDDLTARLREVIQFGPEWKVQRSVIKDGNVDFALSMNEPQQGRGKMTITGKLTPTTTDLILTADSYLAGPGKGHIYTKIKQENARVGECTAGQDTMG